LSLSADGCQVKKERDGVLMNYSTLWKRHLALEEMLLFEKLSHRAALTRKLRLRSFVWPNLHSSKLWLQNYHLTFFGHFDQFF